MKKKKKNEKEEGMIQRSDYMDNEFYSEIFTRESHHDHPIIEDSKGVLRWLDDPDVDQDLNKILNANDYDKNSEIVRKYYRDLGYSLHGYWEVFYWIMNNEYCDEYNPIKEVRKNKLTKILKNKL